MKLNRTTEYGLLALSYMQGKEKGLTASAREIAEHFNLPFEILAKTLQRLKDQGVLDSSFGTRGGYVLVKDLKSVSLSAFLHMMEGPMGVVSCVHDDSCEYSACCSIRSPMRALNTRIADFLNRISLDELIQDHAVRPMGITAFGEEP